MRIRIIYEIYRMKEIILSLEKESKWGRIIEEYVTQILKYESGL